MEARNHPPYLSLVLAAAMLLLLTGEALSADVSGHPTAVQASGLDSPQRSLQNLKERGIFDGPEWDAWRESRRELAERLPVYRTLDTGGEDCASAYVITGLPFTEASSTAGAADDYNCVCPWTLTGAPDVVYQYAPAVDQSISVDLCASSYDTKVYVYAAACTGDPIACNDDACGNVWGYPWASRIDCVPLTAGMTYYVVVDGLFEYEYGNYMLRVNTCTPCTEFPAHDTYATAKIVATSPYTDTDNNACARHDCDQLSSVYSDVWYRFTITEATDVTIDFCGTTPTLFFTATSLMSADGACQPLIACNDENYVICSDFNPTVTWYDVPPGTYCYPVLSLVGGGHPYTIHITGPQTPAGPDFSGVITLTDTRPTNRRFELTHESGEISWIGFTGFCPGTTGQTVSHADSTWDVLPNGDGNDGDSIIFVTSVPLTSGSIETFVLRYPGCTSDLNWVVGGESGVISGGQFVPRGAKLAVHQNSPNPFNPSTTIRFDLAAAAHVRATVYNVMGQAVAVLMDQTATAGTHELQFDAGRLTSGVYVCQVDIPGDQQRLKMLLVK